MNEHSKFVALVETKSNYRNQNGNWLKINEFNGSLVNCEILTSEYIVYADFALSEIKSIKRVIMLHEDSK